jgi:hypothetical protein
MNIGLGQVIIILLILMLFFGNFTIIIRKITSKLKHFKEILKK